MHNSMIAESWCQILLTEPQLPQVLEPPAMAAEHLGQVLCMIACLRLLKFHFRNIGVILTLLESVEFLCVCVKSSRRVSEMRSKLNAVSCVELACLLRLTSAAAASSACMHDGTFVSFKVRSPELSSLSPFPSPQLSLSAC